MRPIASAPDVAAADLLATLDGIRRRLRRRARTLVRGAPLSGSQVELLRLVEARPRVGIGEAAAALGLAPNTVSTLVRGLSAEGLVDRRADPHDGRAARLELTPAARERMRRWRDERTRLLACAFAGLAEEDRGALEASLPALHRLLEAVEDVA